jgi:hypothetical protein
LLAATKRYTAFPPPRQEAARGALPACDGDCPMNFERINFKEIEVEYRCSHSNVMFTQCSKTCTGKKQSNHRKRTLLTQAAVSEYNSTL